MANLTQKNLAELFGLEGLEHITLDCYDAPPAVGAKPVDDLYQFRKELVREMLAFWFSGEVSCYFIGEKGSGKTTFIEQWHAQLNIPLYTVSCDAYTERSDLLGDYVPMADGSLKFQYGPVLRAAIEGTSVSLDEYNTVPAKVLNGLNSLLQGGGIYIPQLEKEIIPAPGFRIFATGNPGNAPSVYQGRQLLDGANRERFWFVKVPYPKREDERKIVVNAFVHQSGLDEDAAGAIADKLLDVAEDVRSKYIGNSDDGNAIPETISTRTLVRWGKAMILFRNQPSNIHMAMRSVLTNALPPAIARVIHEAIHMRTGQEEVAA